jgi:hypothetical protein
MGSKPRAALAPSPCYQTERLDSCAATRPVVDVAQNNDDSANKCKCDRAAGESCAKCSKPKKKPRGRPFPPGVSGNPSGRPKGFGHRIRELTNDGDELLEIALKVARGKLSILTPFGKDAVQVDVLPTAKERLSAVAWLADRGWGKVEQPVVGEDGGPLQVVVRTYGEDDE